MKRTDSPDPSELLPLSPRDFIVLLILADGPSHGYGIVKGAGERFGDDARLDPANLYRALNRMLRLGWVEKRDGEGRRSIFELTSLGRELLRAETGRLDELLHRARPLLSEEG